MNFHRYNGGTGAANLAVDAAVTGLVVGGVAPYGMVRGLWWVVKWMLWPCWGPFVLYARHRQRVASTPIQRWCSHCQARAGYPCIVWDGYAWRALPYPHYERTV